MSSIIPIPTSRINYIETRLNAAERLLALHSAQILDNAGNIAGNTASISTINGEIIPRAGRYPSQPDQYS
jgi:hypothetical protein